jgi:prefoldin subunit 5
MNTKTKKDKESFRVNLVNVLESLDEMIVRSNERLKDLNKNLEKSKAKLNELQLYENKYMKLIKEYNKEFNKSNKGNIA